MTPPERRRILLVSGAPGSGKTTLAEPLAQALGLPLFSKDHIKETLMEALQGPPGDLGFSRRIGGAAMDVLWRMAGQAPAAVLEANFRPHNAYERRQVEALAADVVEVHCVCPPAEAARRFAARAHAGVHPAHPLQELTPALLAEYDQPMGIGTVLRVSTTGPVDIAALAQQIRHAWATGQQPDR